MEQEITRLKTLLDQKEKEIDLLNKLLSQKVYKFVYFAFTFDYFDINLYYRPVCSTPAVLLAFYQYCKRPPTSERPPYISL